jgi:hypothetical protein
MTAVLHVELENRWDALALASRLGGYRWYLVEPERRRWELRVSIEADRPGLPPELESRIADWLAERRLPLATIHAAGVDYTVQPGALHD